MGGWRLGGRKWTLTFEVAPADQIPIQPSQSSHLLFASQWAGGQELCDVAQQASMGFLPHWELNFYQVGNHQVLGQLLMSATTQWEARL